MSKQSLVWRNHFRRSLLEELPISHRDSWSPAEVIVLGPSLAEFQLGESSDGRHLLSYSRRFGEATGDPWLAEAMALFIQEENRHSHWLGEFLKAQGYPLIRASWQDYAFRVLRKRMGFGLMAAVLVCAEVVAVPYYSAVRGITSSEWLRAICGRLLDDEAMHLRFQAANLGAVWRRWPLFRSFRRAHKAMMAVICVAVWRQHGRVLQAAGHSLAGFIGCCGQLLDQVHADALAGYAPEFAEVPVSAR